MIGAIVGCDTNFIIAVNGKIPFYYPADLARFKAITQGTTVIMGSKTWDTIPGTLPGRDIIVVSRRPPETVIGTNRKNIEFLLPRFQVAWSIEDAFDKAKTNKKDIWIAGGAEIYNQTLDKLDFIDLTVVPEIKLEPITSELNIKFFPRIPNNFVLQSEEINKEDNRLTHRIYRKTR